MPLTKKDIARLSGGDEYATYLLQGRAQFERGRASTVKQLRDIYSRTAAGVKNDIEGLTSGTLRHGHMTALEANLTKRAAELNRSILDAAHKGIWMGSEAGSYGPANISTSMLQSAFAGPDVYHLFAGINERATLAMLARTGRDGLMLSDRVWRIGEKYRNAVTTIVQDGVVRGLDSRIMAREIQKYLEPGTWTAHKLDTRQRLGVSKDVSYEAMRLARTELNNAFHEGMVAANQHVPGYLGVRWRLSHQHPVRDVCDDMANDRSHGEAGYYPRGYEPVRPHPQCVAGGTIVSGPKVIGSTTRWYEGEILEIQTVKGRNLTITPNHPVLAPKGWVPAGLLQEGSYVVCCSGKQGDAAALSSAIQNPDNYQVPTLVEDVARSFGETGSMTTVTVPVAAEDFHGDGVGSEVCIIRSDGFLGNSFDSAFFKPYEVELDKIIRIRRNPRFAGHVYNLQTVTGYYISNGIITHNCFCNVIPLYEDIDSFTDRLNEWMNNPASQPDINLWYNNTGKGYLDKPLSKVWSLPINPA